MGCWLGALPIPLDWDRDWQVKIYSLSHLGLERQLMFVVVGLEMANDLRCWDCCWSLDWYGSIYVGLYC